MGSPSHVGTVHVSLPFAKAIWLKMESEVRINLRSLEFPGLARAISPDKLPDNFLTTQNMFLHDSKGNYRFVEAPEEANREVEWPHGENRKEEVPQGEN